MRRGGFSQNNSGYDLDQDRLRGRAGSSRGRGTSSYPLRYRESRTIRSEVEANLKDSVNIQDCPILSVVEIKLKNLYEYISQSQDMYPGQAMDRLNPIKSDIESLLNSLGWNGDSEFIQTYSGVKGVRQDQNSNQDVNYQDDTISYVKTEWKKSTLPSRERKLGKVNDLALKLEECLVLNVVDKYLKEMLKDVNKTKDELVIASSPYVKDAYEEIVEKIESILRILSS